MSSSDPEEPDDDPFAGMLHRVVIPEAADVATIFPEDVDPSREPFVMILIPHASHVLTVAKSLPAAAQSQASGMCLD